MIEFSLRPNTTAAIAIARMMYGIERKTSVKRIITVSVAATKNPAIAPNRTPMADGQHGRQEADLQRHRAP